jgi:hypothetical protein
MSDAANMAASAERRRRRRAGPDIGAAFKSAGGIASLATGALFGGGGFQPGGAVEG